MSDEPTNKELRAEIKRLSDELGLEVTPEGSKAKLLEQLEQLRAQAAARAVEADAPIAGGAVRADPADAVRPASDGPREGEDSSTTPSDSASQADRAGDTRSSPLSGTIDSNAALKRAGSLLEVELQQLADEDATTASRIHGFLDCTARTLASRPQIARVLGDLAALFGTAIAGAPRYVVAGGRSVSIPRGILGPGESVQASDVGGAERLEALVLAGTLVAIARS